MTPSVFKKNVYQYYKTYGRHTLPWRMTRDPYRVLISEIMLQQTQVVRVTQKYQEFLKKFPTVRVLARAPLSEILRTWSGLGYNRRAKFLKQTAQCIVSEYKGSFPHSVRELMKLPGIGRYTASAVSIFAFNQAEVCIETNIRTVFIHHFFPNKKTVSDQILLSYIEKTLDRKNPRTWYWALMDYGSFLKQQGNVSHRKSTHYIRQSPFKGSVRYTRGVILRTLLQKPETLEILVKKTKKGAPILLPILEALIKEQLVVKKGSRYRLVD